MTSIPQGLHMQRAPTPSISTHATSQKSHQPAGRWGQAVCVCRDAVVVGVAITCPPGLSDGAEVQTLAGLDVCCCCRTSRGQNKRETCVSATGRCALV